MDAYRIPSLAKACQVLSWLASDGGAYSVSDISRRLSIPRTTAFRLLRTLCGEGLIGESDGKYRCGAGLLRLGLLALQSVEIWSLAEPVLQRLAQTTGETAHLAVCAGHQMLILHVADSPHPICVSSRPGTLVSIHCAATGKALLAALPREEARRMLENASLEKRTERTLTTIEALETELETVRRQGYAVDDEEYHLGVRCLAAAVFDARDKTVGALGITAAAARFTKRKVPAVGRVVMEAADALSRALRLQTADRPA